MFGVVIFGGDDLDVADSVGAGVAEPRHDILAAPNSALFPMSGLLPD